MARFDEIEGRNDRDGLDMSENPPWLLVGLGLPKVIRLRDAANWTVNNSNPGVVTMTVGEPSTRPERPIVLIPIGMGVSTIEACAPGGRQRIQLRVYTRPLVLHPIAFYFVRDQARPVAHQTRRPQAEAAQILRRLNEIYYPQANILFNQIDLQSITLPGDFGPDIDLPRREIDPSPEFAAVQSATEPGRVLGVRALHPANHARVRVHFVWSIRRAGRASIDTEGCGTIGGDTVLVEDQLSADAGTIVAHEVGHALGLQHRPSDRVRRGWLMYPHIQGLGTFIPKRHVDILNPATTI